MKDLSEIIFSEFPKKKIVIVGDLVADQFLNGTIARVSREAPVFILRHEDTETRAGGAANAAVNVASLGARPVIVGLTGSDPDGRLLCECLRMENVDVESVIASDNYATTTKVRVLAGQHYAPRQQVIRIDYENRHPITPEMRSAIHDNLRAASDGANAIIVSDYNYGVAEQSTVDLAREISTKANIPLIIDSRFRLPQFPGATSATPNQEEVEQILGEKFTVEACEELRARLDYEALLVTCGNGGMILVEKGKKARRFPAVGSKQPVDVTGAGDTVIAVYTLGVAAGLTFEEAAQLANHAGGIVVMKKRTSSVRPIELAESLRKGSEPRSQISASK